MYFLSDYNFCIRPEPIHYNSDIEEKVRMSISNDSRCIKCNSLVTDSIELQIEQHGKIKLGRYDIQGWICDDCFGSSNSQKEKKTMKNSNHQQQETIEPVKQSDVSPNTPKADEAELS
jgi:hypothetical protein